MDIQPCHVKNDNFGLLFCMDSLLKEMNECIFTQLQRLEEMLPSKILSAKSSLILGENKAAFCREGH